MSSTTAPLFSIIIPARNEEKFLPACLDAIAAASRQVVSPIETIVVINRCTDKTEQIAIARGCRIVHNEDKNLAKIRNAGVREARGEIIVAIDADSVMSANMLLECHKALATEKYIGGGVLMLPSRWSLGIVLSGAILIPVALYYRIAGGLFFCYKKDFDAIGGFNENLLTVEDIDFAKRLKAHGKKQGKGFTMLIRAYITTSMRKFDRFGDWYFLKNPRALISVFRGTDREVADKIWYDFER